MTSKLQSMKERLAAAADDAWTSVQELVTDEVKVPRHAPRGEADAIAANRRREAKHLAFLRAEKEKALLSRLQFEQNRQERLASLIDDDPHVVAYEEEWAKDKTTLDAFYVQYRGVCQRLAELETMTLGDLSETDPQKLVEMALAQQVAGGAEHQALLAVREELERRIANAEAALGEKQEKLHRLKRTVIHHRCDQQITEMYPVIKQLEGMLTQLHETEELIRGLGGVRQYFLTPALADRLTHALERWDRELADVKACSEKYQPVD